MSAQTLGLFAPPPLRFDQPPRVAAVNTQTSTAWFGSYHYLADRHPASRDWGVFAPDLMGVVAVGESANVSGLAARFGLTGWRGNKEITRVAVHPDSPPNTASRAIALVLSELARGGLEWAFSYADTGQGHHGGIYQALNAAYVGLSPARHGYLLDGEAIHPRQVVQLFGTEGASVFQLAAAQGRELRRVVGMSAPKHTYILPVGPPHIRAAIRRALVAHTKPYPKRAEGVEETTPASQPGSDGAMPSLRSMAASVGFASEPMDNMGGR